MTTKSFNPNYVPQNQIQCVGLDSITLKVGIQENYRQIYFVGAKFSSDEDNRTHATQQTKHMTESSTVTVWVSQFRHTCDSAAAFTENHDRVSFHNFYDMCQREAIR